MRHRDATAQNQRRYAFELQFGRRKTAHQGCEKSPQSNPALVGRDQQARRRIR